MAGGRQREFSQQKALESAMQVFWKKGFVGASLTDLTTSMGINKPSMYSAFGNKEQLFVKATQYYIDRYASPPFDLLSGDEPIKQRVARYLRSVISSQCHSDKPKGCYISLCVAESEGEQFPESAAEIVEQANHFGENALTDFFRTEQSSGNLAAGTSAEKLGRYFIAFLHGTSSLARGGRSEDELLALVNIAVEAIV
ncbi:TetR/AcrR family transcriptional regulator [Alteromonas sp. KUL49]|uniref:TetR/AcrR family transcriptional regulator n=1 Tax=Alteromonas sp. KUL49 TaxID=2480798 RepID=UPI00102F1C9C|nr:TetR/AcrR family transcriptional regulator [Alteromonas sp. KUL49]TAP39371.1 TetR/AcrR family transcriptional regulator [Alteromonas sp. KUL49]GEA12166.1 TetR family transcriptional regulator [Alteromonas sp. KUL49]